MLVALRSVFAIAIAICASNATALAQDEHRLQWSDDWARVHPASYAASGVAIGAALVLDYGLNPGPEALVRGPAVFDGAWRERLMAQQEEDRERAATLSDVLLGTLLAWPLVDALGVAGLGDLNSDVAWQLTMVTIEAYATDLLLSTVAKQFVARERPHGARCSLEDRLENPLRCGERGRLRSFYSGHSSTAFTAAGVTCMNHVFVGLYGSPAADWLACGAAMLTAGITATLRVVADRHYASDILIGALIGLAIGTLLPYSLHYAWDPTPPVAGTPAPLRSAPLLSFAGAL